MKKKVGSESVNRQFIIVSKKELGYKYMKTTIKTNKIVNKDNLLLSFAFIKIIARSMPQI